MVMAESPVSASISQTKISICLSLPAATKLGQGNIFTSVCQEFCPQGGGGVCLSACWDIPPGADTPPPPRPGRPPPDQADPPTADTPPLEQTNHPPRTRQTPPSSRHTTPPPRTRQTPPGSRLQHTVYERPVRILLECILVCFCFGSVCNEIQLRRCSFCMDDPRTCPSVEAMLQR